MNERSRTLRSLGQSLWYDNIRRGLLVNGELAALIRDRIVVGVTSNPTIFEKAISSSNDYDQAFARLIAEGRSVDEIYLALVEEDIRATADLLRPVYDETHAVDGFISVEVSPHLAHDTRGTVEDALRLHNLLNRPNVMIKVPGTPEGVPAIRELTAHGVSVNVTLLFSLSQYEAIARAYIEGLEDRISRGEPIDRIASVASFFVSRVDTLVDKRLAKELPDREAELRGRAAIANARLAFERGHQLFSGSRWEAIAAKGGRPQRLLWASTGTKDPRYSDTLYVDELIGPDTVNTVPPATLNAFLDHGNPRLTLPEGLEHARALVRELHDKGIDLEQAGQVLQKEGVAAFAASMDSLMKVISDRRHR